MKKLVENVIIVLFFVIVVAFPFFAHYFIPDEDLSGAEEKVELSWATVDEYITQNFPGRSFIVKSKNQFLYSFFDVSPNDAITKVGDTLFSTEALNYYYHGLHLPEEKDVDELISKFKKFNRICDSKGKKMMIVITPTKPRFYKELLPFADDIILAYQDKIEKNSYDILKEKISKTNLHYFDTIECINNNKKEIIDGEVPLFYKSSHHWSTYKANLVALKFHEFMRRDLGLHIPLISITASPSEVAVYPDSDLFDVLNVYDKPNEKFYKSVTHYENLDFDNLNYTVSGGSFLGGLLLPYATISVLGDVYHIENKHLLCNKYKDDFDFESYEQLNKEHNLLDHLKKTDVFIFEINELNVYNATFGFIDYLLDHSEEI